MDKIPDIFRSDDGPEQWKAKDHHVSEQHLDADGNFKPYFTGGDALIEQAERQVAAAGDTPVEWSVAEEPVANWARDAFAEFGIPIDVTYVPPQK